MDNAGPEPISHFLVTDEVFARCEALVGQVASRIRPLLPQARVEHVGATAVPGLFTKGDLDVAVQVPADQFDAAVAVLDRLYSRIYQEFWVEGDFADYGLPPLGGVQISVKLVALGGSRDFFVRLRDLLRRRADFRAQVNAVKRDQRGEGMTAYLEHKAAIYNRLLSWRTSTPLEWYDFEEYPRPPDSTEVLAEVWRPDGTTFRVLGHYLEADDLIRAADGRAWGWETPEQVRLWAEVSPPGINGVRP